MKINDIIEYLKILRKVIDFDIKIIDEDKYIEITSKSTNKKLYFSNDKDNEITIGTDEWHSHYFFLENTTQYQFDYIDFINTLNKLVLGFASTYKILENDKIIGGGYSENEEYMDTIRKYYPNANRVVFYSFNSVEPYEIQI